MISKEFVCENLAKLPVLAKDMLASIPKSSVVLFYGEMGVGKTTLIRQLCASLNIQDEISSPTFSLVNEYLTPDGSPLFHFDFYRIEDEIEALDMGVEEYFYSGSMCFVEWPDKIKSFLPDDAVIVEMTQEEGVRTIKLSIK